MGKPLRNRIWKISHSSEDDQLIINREKCAQVFVVVEAGRQTKLCIDKDCQEPLKTGFLRRQAAPLFNVKFISCRTESMLQ